MKAYLLRRPRPRALAVQDTSHGVSRAASCPGGSGAGGETTGRSFFRELTKREGPVSGPLPVVPQATCLSPTVRSSVTTCRAARCSCATDAGAKLRTMVCAVIYIRVSTKEQTENLSLRPQLRACEDYCRREGFEILERFDWNHISAQVQASRMCPQALASIERFCRR